MTCKQTSRKDLIYVSPEIREWIQAVSVTAEPFPDHAVLTVALSIPGKPEPFPYWYKPHCIAYTSSLAEALDEVSVAQPIAHQGTPTGGIQYQAIWTEHEQWVDNLMRVTANVGCPAHQKGRGTTLVRKFKRSQAAPIKTGRHGEPSPQFAGRSQQLKHWFTQWRRLINLERAQQSESTSPHLPNHIRALWKSIYFAPGFQCCSLHQAWITRTKSKHAANPNAVFQAVRDPGPHVPVEVLLEQKSCEVLEVVDEGSVTVDSSLSLDPTLPLVGPGVVLKAEIMSEDQIWFQTTHNLSPGTTLTQQKPVGSLDAMFESFRQEWSRRSDKRISTPDSRWDSISDFIGAQVPQGSMQCSPITLTQWGTIQPKCSRNGWSS